MTTALASGVCSVMRERTKRHGAQGKQYARKGVDITKPAINSSPWPLFGHCNLGGDAVNRPGCSRRISGPKHRQFPPCERAHGYIPLHAKPASNGIKPGFSGGRAVPVAAERYVAPQKKWVENLLRKQELKAVGCMNTLVGTALCWMAGVNRDLWKEEQGSGLVFFKIRREECLL